MITIKTRKLRHEPLEDRRMLSITAGLDDATLQMFHAQDALFAENAGQWDADDVYFGYNQGGTQIYFTDDGLEFGLSRTVDDGADSQLAESPATDLEPFDAKREIESTHFSLSFDGAQPTIPVGTDLAETVFNYHLGAQEDWVDGVATFKTVIYNDLYSGIDLHTFSLHGQMKYEFHVSPGVDYSQIELSYDGIEGLSIADDGSLHIATELGEIVDEDLYIYQVIDGQQVEVAGQFTLIDADTYTFTITGDYDPTAGLVIDPNLDWGSYLGGSSTDSALGVSTDATGNVYVCGYTASIGWMSGGWDTSYGGSDGFLVKLSSSGTHLWSTYLGGSSDDYAYGVSKDAMGNVYVCGETHSIGWTSGGWDTSYGGSGDGFLVKLNSSGAHIWSTYLGGNSNDLVKGVSTDATSSVYVCGVTRSSDWVSGGWNDSYGGDLDGSLVKLNSSGAHLWSTYLGGNRGDYAKGVSVDAADNIYVCGYTESSCWVSGGWVTSYGGDSDGFLVKLNPSGAHLWSTYLGGSNDDVAWGASTDVAGNVYVCGRTTSSGWVSGGWDMSFGGNIDGFLVMFDSSGVHLWGTYLGGSSEDRAYGVSTDAASNVYVCGDTYSSGWVSGRLDTSFFGGGDGFLIKLNSSGTHLWSTHLGGNSEDSARGVSTDTAGNVYVCGLTTSSGWGIVGGWDASLGGYYDGYVVKINDTVPGDANGDGHVDGSDVTILAGNWQAGVNDGQTVTWRMGDFNGDGKVDGSDVTILAGNWQAGVSSTVAVSEPEPEAEPVKFVPPANALLGVATVPRRNSLPLRRFITPTPESSDAVLAESTWSENDYTAIAKDFMPVSVKKSTDARDKLFSLEMDPYVDKE